MTLSDPSPRSPYRFVTYLVAGAFFMELLDGTVIATALPQMGVTFHVGAVAMNVGMTAYLLAVAVFTPISGWIADRFGARSVFASALLGFTLASVLCGVSQSLWMFTAARVVQGAAGAAMAPVGRLIVLRMTDKANLMQAIATIVGALALEASALVRGGSVGSHHLADFQLAFVAIGALMLWGVVDCIRLEKTAGQTVSGHKALA